MDDDDDDKVENKDRKNESCMHGRGEGACLANSPEHGPQVLRGTRGLRGLRKVRLILRSSFWLLTLFESRKVRSSCFGIFYFFFITIEKVKKCCPSKKKKKLSSDLQLTPVSKLIFAKFRSGNFDVDGTGEYTTLKIAESIQFIQFSTVRDRLKRSGFISILDSFRFFSK